MPYLFLEAEPRKVFYVLLVLLCVGVCMDIEVVQNLVATSFQLNLQQANPALHHLVFLRSRQGVKKKKLAVNCFVYLCK